MSDIPAARGRVGRARASAAYAMDRVPMAMAPEAELLIRAQRYETDALLELFDRHFEAVYSHAYARLGDARLAEEAADATFKLALARLGGYRDRGAGFQAWLLAQANAAICERLKVGAQPAAGQGAPGNLRRALATLSAEQQEVISLRFLVGLSLQETAAATGRRKGQVTSLQHHALSALRKALEGEE